MTKKKDLYIYLDLKIKAKYNKKRYLEFDILQLAPTTNISDNNEKIFEFLNDLKKFEIIKLIYYNVCRQVRR